MFVDARQLTAESIIETGICIIGAGAAGITLAHEIAARRLDACVVESGAVDLQAATQSLYEAESVGLPYFPLDANRQRSFGGTTNLWAGWCRPLDGLDIESRSWVPLSGWPISSRELLPYYRRAHLLCELPSSEYGPTDWEQRLETLPLPGERIIAKIFRLSPPTRFGQVYREALSGADTVQVLLHANAMALDANDAATAVTRLRVGCLSGNRFSVRARHYVLAAGGIENARLLLLSNTVQPSGLGNEHDSVGRYFMEHMHFPATMLALSGESGRAVAAYARGTDRTRPRLALASAVQAQEQLLNHSVMLTPLHPYDRLVGALARRIARRAHPLRDRLPPAFDPGIAPGGGVLGRFTARGAARRWQLHLTMEQAPNRESRVTLSPQRDALGMPRARLAWHTTPLDQRTAEIAPQLVGAEFTRAGMGRLLPDSVAESTRWPPPPLQGLRGHHMGTTRMSTDAHHGVVDAQCRVHGIANLYIAGSSVFPTSGAGAPTLTIVALAVRLADHLRLLGP